jgi:hypothetical protein
MATWDDRREKLALIRHTFGNCLRYRRHGQRPLPPMHKDTVRRLAAAYARLAGSYKGDGMNQITESRYPKHPEAISYINRLVIDLKLQLAGEEHDPITPERLAEWARHRVELELCTEWHEVKYAWGDGPSGRTYTNNDLSDT